MKRAARTFGFSLVLILMTTCANYGQLYYQTSLPKKINEASGLISFTGSEFWVIEDGGNPDLLYKLNSKGKLLRSLKVSNAKNKDWEALTADPEGNIYIGDFGNNNNSRKDLVIYKLPNPEVEKGDKIPAQKIRFSYPEQAEFPPDKNQRNFDAEAMFFARDSLFIITKNRSEPFPGTARVYRMPAIPGEYQATFVAEIKTCQDRQYCQITGAAYDPARDAVALLAYGRIWLFNNFSVQRFNQPQMVNLQTWLQLEGICFDPEGQLFIVDEKNGVSGRNLYRFQIPD